MGKFYIVIALEVKVLETVLMKRCKSWEVRFFSLVYGKIFLSLKQVLSETIFARLDCVVEQATRKHFSPRIFLGIVWHSNKMLVSVLPSSLLAISQPSERMDRYHLETWLSLICTTVSCVVVKGRVYDMSCSNIKKKLMWIISEVFIEFH